jgi:hypothetical protein
MSTPVHVRVQREDFDTSAETAKLTAGRTDVGAVVTFAGLCRDEAGTLAALELEHYPGMAEAEITRICNEATARWPLLRHFGHPSLRQDRAGREHRAGDCHIQPPAGSLRCRQFRHGFPQDLAHRSGRKSILPMGPKAAGSAPRMPTMRRREKWEKG